VTLVFANRIVAIGPDGRATVVVEDRGGVLLSGPTHIAWAPGVGRFDPDPYVFKGRSAVLGLSMVHQR
jgi:hypothetical protein